jgi:DNA-directed RNA polymerase
MYETSAPEVVLVHNIYLQGMLELAQEDGSEISMADIESWFNKEIAANAVEPNAETCIILLRASMTLLQGAEQERSIRKYLELVQTLGPEVFEEVNSSPDFTDEEFDILIRSQPDVFEEPASLEAQPEVSNEPLISTPAGRAIAIQHGLIEDPSLRVKPVEQKGVGLKTLKAALAPFEPGKGVPFPQEIEGTDEFKARAYAYQRQLNLEKATTEAAAERWREENSKLKEIGIHGTLSKSVVKAWMWDWYSALLPLVKKELAEVSEVLSDTAKARKSDDRLIYGPYIELATPEQLAAITVQCAVQLVACCRGSSEYESSLLLRTSILSMDIGKAVQQTVTQTMNRKRRAAVRKQRLAVRKEKLNKLSKGDVKFNSPEQSELGQVVSEVERRMFPPHVRLRIGALLIEKLLQTAVIKVSRKDPRTADVVTSTQSAFSISSGFVQGKKVWILNPHHELQEKLRSSDGWVAMDSFRLPMLAEPKPWSGYENGGYFTRCEPVVRTKSFDETQRVYAISAVEKGDMDTILAGLDVLGKVPWQVNKNVFKVALEAWNKGEGLAGLQPDKLQLRRPEEPAADAPFHDRMRWMKKMKQYENEKGGHHSQKCFQNFQLEIARAYLNEKFYFPHNIDFRGRAYPIPAILNHMGADLARGLLTFENGKELGQTGLKWLKVHLANVYGYDKASLSDRENFTMQHIDEVYDSATNPLTGNRWWAKAEDPWQTLACCMELKNALDSPHPEQYISHLPVHQDGTCNGLQHYAALGGDEAGATQVNLEPSDRPQDVYTAVSELVRESIAADAKQGDPIAQFLEGKITRKVVKRTVMTNVYGVTYQGAKLQVYEELKPLCPDFEENETIKTLMQPASYVALKIFKALTQIFNGARDIQVWLGRCCARITSSVTPEQIENMRRHFEGDPQPFGKKYKTLRHQKAESMEKLNQKNWEFRSSVIWTTPLKMPVVQPYRDFKSERVKTALHTSQISKPRMTDAVSRRKQLQGFPPNFIHSLDASHMILSALKCHENGMTFAAVHDSFWTHAADVPQMNVILRDAFVQMHSEDIIGRLKAEFETRYGKNMFRASIRAKSSTGEAIIQWRRENLGQISKSSLTASFRELAMEAERQELLQSESKEDRERGEKMVTPTSIYLSMKDDMALEAELATEVGLPRTPRILSQNTATADDVAAETTELEDDTANVQDEESFGDAEESEDVPDDLDAEVDGKVEAASTEKAPPKQKQAVQLTFWLPLTFPPVPKKGTWDIKRLKDSKYFFS